MKYSITPICLFIAMIFFVNPGQSQENSTDICQKRSEKISGDNQKYSMHADVDGAFALSTISCSVELRKELCAMEMVSFDQTARVFDLETGAEIEMTGAFFILTPHLLPDGKSTILAFKNEAGAKKHADQNGGQVISFDELVKLRF